MQKFPKIFRFLGKDIKIDSLEEEKKILDGLSRLVRDNFECGFQGHDGRELPIRIQIGDAC
ncbi:hypothetical protein SELR_pSRC400630 (plasmid) [Selenomonas ruminantium subsp. lactilytica TAM6421]|uniref:Uncharacterized protein n=1 Tax=Selenomonas ruminantium subsp. lactilytica (strain NBRC 103574 / TAM6421) TaxID=927704 RepID=I0GVC7_SELRL|nr:hypothetical protein SELR_pSRC400630 [Selenomonas ruminantium subsp. lactilytica TAM6421]